MHAPLDNHRRYATPRIPQRGGPMAGLIERTTNIIKAKWSKLLDRAEKPSEQLDYSYEKQLELLQNVKRGVADVVTAKKRLELQTQSLEQNVVKLDTQARQAVAQGREDLARQALERKSAVQSQLQGLDGQIKGLEAQQEKLGASEQERSARVESFARRRRSSRRSTPRRRRRCGSERPRRGSAIRWPTPVQRSSAPRTRRRRCRLERTRSTS